jgi:pyridoxine 4-dehydrogenase
MAASEISGNVPIPGTSKVKHLQENTAAALIELDNSRRQELEDLGKD